MRINRADVVRLGRLIEEIIAWGSKPSASVTGRAGSRVTPAARAGSAASRASARTRSREGFVPFARSARKTRRRIRPFYIEVTHRDEHLRDDDDKPLTMPRFAGRERSIPESL